MTHSRRRLAEPPAPRSARDRARGRIWRTGRVAAFALAVTPAAQAVQERAALDLFDVRAGGAEQVPLPRALREVSGLAVAADGRLFAHADERGMIFQIDYRRGAIVKSFSLGSPALAADFEGIAIAEGRFYLLTSDGRLYETRDAAHGAAARYLAYDTGFGALCELEGLAYEPSDRSLLIGCKRPRDRSLQGLVTMFRWSIDRKRPAVPPRISTPVAAATRGTGAKTFHPSAIERDARTGHYLVVAGPQSVVAEITSAGAVVATRALNRRAHPQPEGIAFLGDSVMLIADESVGGKRHPTLAAYRRAR